MVGHAYASDTDAHQRAHQLPLPSTRLMPISCLRPLIQDLRTMLWPQRLYRGLWCFVVSYALLK